MDNVGQEIIVFESVVDVHFLVVDSQRSRFDAAFLSKVDKKKCFLKIESSRSVNTSRRGNASRS